MNAQKTNKAKLSFLFKNIHVDFYLIGLLITLIVFYLLGMKITNAFSTLNSFSTSLVMDTAQVARNTMRGDFFITKYILPVGYTYFPTTINHPDFIRHPFQVLIYAALFLIFSPSPIVIKLLNSFLFLLNGCLIYRFVIKVQNIENAETDRRKAILIRLIAILTAITASLFSFSYFKMALSDSYEVITYSLILINLNVVINKNTKPLFYGILCGLLYLSKPNLALFGGVFAIYFIVSRFPAKKWFSKGVLLGLGILIVVSPFIIRSYVLTGEPTFTLQQHIDSIKEIEQTHDELYKSFSPPPPVFATIFGHKRAFLSRWFTRVVLALKNLFSKEYIIAWLGLPFFLIFFKKSRRLVYSYLIFLVIHIVIVANYLEGPDTARIYTPLLGFFVVLGFAGLFKACFSLLGKIQNIKLQNVLLLTILITVLSSSTYVEFNGGLPPVKKAEPIPEQVIEKMQEINPPCMYSTVPILSAWFLDIPTIYRPVNNSQMLTKGPQECKHLFYIEDSKDERNLKGFLSQHGNLIFQYDKYMYYELID